MYLYTNTPSESGEISKKSMSYDVIVKSLSDATKNGYVGDYSGVSKSVSRTLKSNKSVQNQK